MVAPNRMQSIWNAADADWAEYHASDEMVDGEEFQH